MANWTRAQENELALWRASRRARRVRYAVGALGVLAVGLMDGCHWELWPCHHTTFVSLRVQPDSVAMTGGQQAALQAIGQYQGTTSAGDACTVDGGPGGSVTWQTSDSTVARVTYTNGGSANVQGVAVGRAEVSATNSLGTQGRSIVLVTVPAQ